MRLTGKQQAKDNYKELLSCSVPLRPYLAAEHEGDGAVGAGHFAVTEQGGEALQPPCTGGHLLGAVVGAVWSRLPPAFAPTSGSQFASSASHHPPSFLARLCLNININRPPPSAHCLRFFFSVGITAPPTTRLLRLYL